MTAAEFLDGAERQDAPRPVPLSPHPPNPGQNPGTTPEDTVTTPDTAPAAVSPADASAPVPQPITPADAHEPAGLALASAAAQLRDDVQSGHRPAELSGVPWRFLVDVSRWLDARAGLYGVQPLPTGWGFSRD